MRSDALRAFRKWEEKEDKVEYWSESCRHLHRQTFLKSRNSEILIPDYNDVDEPDGEQAFWNYMIYGGIWLLKVDEQTCNP